MDTKLQQDYAAVHLTPAHWRQSIVPNKMWQIRRRGRMARVLKPGERLQFADILVEKPVAAGAKGNIDLWTG